LPSPERDVAQAAAVEAASEPSAPADEWPPVPAVFQPQWASVAPVQPAWSAPTVPKPGRTPPVPPTWVGSPPRTVNRLPSPPPPSPLDPAVGYVAQPPLTPAAVAVGVAAVTLPAARPLAPVRPVSPARPIPSDPSPVPPDEYDLPAVDAATAEDADSEVGGPSTVSTLFWMAVTGVVVVGLVLAFLHLMTGVFR
jgi:hypothetical protein